MVSLGEFLGSSGGVKMENTRVGEDIVYNRNTKLLLDLNEVTDKKNVFILYNECW